MLTGILLKTLSTLAFTAMALGVRVASPAMPVAEIVFFRSIVALVVLLVWLGATGSIKGLATNRPYSHLGRSLTGSMGMFSNFTALTLLPLADATAYFYAYPIFVTVIAGLALREPVHATRWLAVLVGFGGVVAMMSEHLGFAAGFDAKMRLGAGIALFGALCAAFSIVQTRRLAQLETTGAIVFYFTSVCAFFGALVMGLAKVFPAVLGGQAFVAPDARAWTGMIVAGLAGGVAQIFATASYRYADASLLAAYDYLAMVWALLASMIFLGETPSPAVLAGAAAISGAGLLALQERRFQKSEKFGIPNEIV